MNSPDLVRQHLIDPEICIRCNTCEEMCPIDAITHDAQNYVVKFDVCNGCNACMAPCPTGAIDSFRQVLRQQPFSLDDQYSWKMLPAESVLNSAVSSGNTINPEINAAATKALATQDAPEIVQMKKVAESGLGGHALAPWSASHPYINLYTPNNPITATVTGNYRLTSESASSDIRHIVLDFGNTPFPVLEGQSIGIIPPGVNAEGKPHLLRMYSVASPREGERPGYNNIALTVKRVTADHLGNPAHGLCSNYVCDLQKGDVVNVTGPHGATYLMPNHPSSSLLMICTGTGSAPMRAMTERRRRRMHLKEGGRLVLYFGARTSDELPYFGPLQKLPKDFIEINFAFSRLENQPKHYVQDLIREKGNEVTQLLTDENCYVYICGLKGMETGVLEAFRDICRAAGLDWETLRPTLLKQGRFHVETY